MEEFIKICLQGKGWKHCSENWNSWDFERTADRLKLQVKQAAQLQTWDLDEHKNVVIERKTRDVRFSVAPAKGYYENGILWRRLPFPQRLAELYVFAYHPLENSSADHWDVEQWRFYVWREVDLPPGSKSVSLAFVQSKSSGVSIGALEPKISQIAGLMSPNGRTETARPHPRDPVDDAEPLGSSG